MTLSAAPLPPTYPARPVNGGPLPLARPKRGAWRYEPKYNGWRTVVHAPTGAMFNRHGARLSIAAEFSAALYALEMLAADTGIEWFDCEALERRHDLGRGCLFVLDFIGGTRPPGAFPCEAEEACPEVTLHHSPAATLLQRSAVLDEHLPRLPFTEPPEPGRLYRPDLVPGTLDTWAALQRINREWRCEFYEGLVAKREDSIYPMQLRSDKLETASWMKHRWAF